MSLVTNGRVLFNSIPSGYPEPGKTTIHDTTQTIDIEQVPLNGGFLIKTTVLPIDPYIRGRMRSPEIKSYAPAFIIGEPLEGFGIGVVLRSELSGVKKGDHVYGVFKYQEYSVIANLDGAQIIENTHDLPWSLFVGVTGMPGKAAFMGWNEFSKSKKVGLGIQGYIRGVLNYSQGEVVFVSTGAGTVGSLVIQLAKRDGLKVIASAGSEEKVQFMKDIGADVAFNYKTTDTQEILAKEGPIDIYWDNVGGATLDAALEEAAPHGRFLMCGSISGYNSEPYPNKNLHHIFAKCLKLSGFTMWSLEPKWGKAFNETIPSLIASGEVKYKEDVAWGLDKLGDALLAVQKGMNYGKAVVLLPEE